MSGDPTSVDCPTCNAPAGTSCIEDRYGRFSTRDPHPARKRAAAAAPSPLARKLAHLERARAEILEADAVIVPGPVDGHLETRLTMADTATAEAIEYVKAKMAKEDEER